MLFEITVLDKLSVYSTVACMVDFFKEDAV